MNRAAHDVVKRASTAPQGDGEPDASTNVARDGSGRPAPPMPADAGEAVLYLTYGLAVAGGNGLRSIGRRLSAAPEPGPSPVPASERGVARTLPTAAFGMALAANRRARRGVRAAAGFASGAARALGADRLAEAARRPVLDALRPWYESGLRERQAGLELTEAVAREGMGAVTEGVVGVIDIGEIVDRLDLDSIIAGVDIDGIVSRLEISNIVLQSTGGIMSDSLEFARGAGRGADSRIQAIVDRLLRRRVQLEESTSHEGTASDAEAEPT